MSFSPTTDCTTNFSEPLTWDRMIDVCEHFNEQECYQSHKQFYIAHTFSWENYKKSVIELFYANRNNKRSIDLPSLNRFARTAVDLYNSNRDHVSTSFRSKNTNEGIQIACRFGRNNAITYAEVVYEGRMLCCFEMMNDYSSLRVYSDNYVFCDHSMYYIPTNLNRGPYIYGLDQFKILRA